MGEAIASNLMELSRLKTPVITVLIGEGGSGGAIALAVSDKIAMLENSVYSILSPEGFASILWKDSSLAPKAATLMKMTANEVCEMGLIDEVIPEPIHGAKNDDGGEMANVVKEYIARSLKSVKNEDLDALVSKRFDKIRNFGREYIK